MKNNAQFVTGGCCHLCCSVSYDSDEHIEPFVLRRKFSVKNDTETMTTSHK